MCLGTDHYNLLFLFSHSSSLKKYGYTLNEPIYVILARYHKINKKDALLKETIEMAIKKMARITDFANLFMISFYGWLWGKIYFKCA